ncbi:Organic cation transporter-like protein [Pseudolycoriella hygida]|uniref:Organic cation transporter-like protein n=1 Tax=Pseudolycoriella hygida TaxID=35572 RepID=A0A9Q0SAD4_9DIPT|nr:Organic cation transporter-like protein [Pseudolycoriella hygida]
MSENDAVGKFLGPFGKWQLRSTLLIYLVKIPTAWFMACLIFTAKSPKPGEIYCKPWHGLDVTNTTSWIESAHKKTFNRIENEESFNFCWVNKNLTERSFNLTVNDDNGTLVECLEFENRPSFNSIIHQFELFCTREALVALSQSFHLFGVLMGGILAYYMMKRVSPRRIMLSGMVAQIFLGPLTGYAPTYELHLFFRFGAAVTCSMMCIGIVIVTDITSGKYRVVAICLFEQFWSIGVILLPAISSWWSAWSTIYIAISIPTVVLILLCYWIPDSPRWLLKHGKVTEAFDILKEAAKVNSKSDFKAEDLNKQLCDLAEFMRHDLEDPTLLSIWDVPLTNKLRLFVGHLGWSIYLTMYLASLLNVRTMGRNSLEVNVAIAGACEIVGTFIGLYLILNTERKWTYMSQLNILMSAIAFSANYLPQVAAFERMVVYMAAAMLFKIALSTSVAIFVTSMTEIVSPDKRKICNHSGVTCSRTVAIAAPFIGYFVTSGQFGNGIEFDLDRTTTNSFFFCSPADDYVFDQYKHFVSRGRFP